MYHIQAQEAISVSAEHLASKQLQWLKTNVILYAKFHLAELIENLASVKGCSSSSLLVEKTFNALKRRWIYSCEATLMYAYASKQSQ